MTSWGGAALGLEQRLLGRFRAAVIPRDRPLIVGFSGGPDSLALAAALMHVRAVTGVPVHLVHIDHRLRESSAGEAEAARTLGRQIGTEVTVLRVPTAPQEAHPNIGIEDAARRERYRLLGEEARRVGARYIATAHHQNDQAETVLLHLLRGSGLHGAAGMAELAPLPSSDRCDISHIDPGEAIRLWRPFLGEPRSAILDYLRHRELTPLADPSNDDVSLRRNALRHRAMPELEAAFPGARAALARFAALAAEEDLLLEATTERALVEMAGAGNRLRISGLRQEPRALQRRILRRWLVEKTGETTIGAERVEAVLRWAGGTNPAGRVELPGGWHVRRSGESLIVARTGRGTERGGTGEMTTTEPRATGVARILIDEDVIRLRIAEIARELDEEYADSVPLLVGVLNGAITFMTDLMRAMTVPLEVDFMAVSSYGAATQSSGVVRILKDLDQEIEGRRVIVVEDIVDSGLTLQYLLDNLERRNPADIAVVALLKKDKPDAIQVQVDKVGFTIPDEFVIGFGLDYAGKYRNLPYVAVLDPSVYAEN
jgi:hypoxanthine phosphoribosyltransferase